MVSFLSLALLSLFIQRNIVSSQSTPYSIIFTNRADEGNTLTLQCKGDFGSDVMGASFYRNGQTITNSSCLTSYPTSTSSQLRIELLSQECDGFFSCGKDDILSNPAPLYGKHAPAWQHRYYMFQCMACFMILFMIIFYE